MTILQIIIFASWIISFWLGRKSAFHNGYIQGRREMRKYYEQVGR